MYAIHHGAKVIYETDDDNELIGECFDLCVAPTGRLQATSLCGPSRIASFSLRYHSSIMLEKKLSYQQLLGEGPVMPAATCAGMSGSVGSSCDCKILTGATCVGCDGPQYGDGPLQCRQQQPLNCSAF